MKLARAFTSLLLLSGVLLLSGTMPANASSETATSYPQHVIDDGGMFSSAEEKELAETLFKNHEKYDLYFGVQTVTSLEGKKLEQASLERAKELALGEADIDNGVLIYMSREDRKVRFELGVGVSGKVTDAEMKQIIDSKVTTEFKNEEYVRGVNAGMTAVGKEYTGETVGLKSSSNKEDDFDEAVFYTWAGWITGLVLLAIVSGFVLNHFCGEPATIRARERDWKESIERLEKIKLKVASIKHNPDMKEYKALPSAIARGKWLEGKYPEFHALLKAHSKSDTANVSFLDSALYVPITKSANMIGYGLKYENPSVSKVFYYNVLGSKSFDHISVDAANKHIVEYNKIAHKMDEKQRKERAKEERRRMAARKVWDSLPAGTRRALQNARSDSERKKLLRGTAYQNDFLTNLPAISALFLNGSSGSSSSGYSSGSSSRSSGSSYSSYDSGSSYSSGGSYDGGGSSGSW